MREKIKSIDYLKGIMAVGIVLFHYTVLTDTSHNDINFPLYDILRVFYNSNYGNVLVEMFFLISGFCFFHFYSENIKNEKINGKTFFLKRFFRLYPLYIFTTVVVAVLQLIYNKINGRYFGAGVDFSAMNIVLNILCMSRGYVTNEIYPYNGPAWFINVLIIDYFLFFIISKYIKNVNKRLGVIGGLIILGLTLKFFNFQFPIFNVEVGRGLTNFFMGGIIEYIYNKKHIQIVSLLIIACAFFLNLTSYYYIVLLLFPSLLILLILNDKYIPDIKILKYLGKISFSMYLIHYCYMGLIKILPYKFNYYDISFFVFFWIGLLLISGINYIFFEKNVSKALENKFNFMNGGKK